MGSIASVDVVIARAMRDAGESYSAIGKRFEISPALARYALLRDASIAPKFSPRVDEAEVLRLRREGDGMTYREIAARLVCSHATVGRICYGTPKGEAEAARLAALKEANATEDVSVMETTR